MSFSLSGSTITQTGTDANLSGLAAIAGVTTTTEGNVTRYNIGTLSLSVSGTLTICGSGVYEQLAFLGDANNDTTDILVNPGATVTIGVSQSNAKDYRYNYGYPALLELRDSAADSSGQNITGVKASLYVSTAATCNVYGQTLTLRGGLGGKINIYNSYVYCSTYYPNGTYTILDSRIECHAAVAAGMYLLTTDGVFSGLDRVGGASYIGLSGGSSAGTYSIANVPPLPTGMPVMSAGLLSAGGVFEFTNSLLGTAYTYTTSSGRYYDARQHKQLAFAVKLSSGTGISGALVWVRGATGMTPVTATTDGSGNTSTMTVLLGTAVATAGTLAYTYNSKSGDSTDDYDYRVRSFGHLFAEGITIAKGNGVLTTGVTLVADPRVTAASKSAAQAVTGVAWDVGTLSVTEDVTTAEMWDWVKAWLCDNPAEAEADYIGVALDFADLDIDVAAGVTITGSLTTGGTVTLGSGASISGVYTDATGTHVTITASWLASGTRVRLYDVTNAVELYNAVLSGAGLSFATTWTADATIELRHDHDDYRAGTLTGILTSAGLTFLGSQDADPVATESGLSPAALTEFVFDATGIQVEITDGDNYTEWLRMYVAWQHYQTTEEGVASDLFGRYTSVDGRTYNLRVSGMLTPLTIRNNNLSAGLTIGGGYVVPDVGQMTDYLDYTGGPIWPSFEYVFTAQGAAAITVPEGERVITMASTGAHYARG